MSTLRLRCKLVTEWKGISKEVVEESQHLQASAAKFSIIFSTQPAKLFERGSVGLLRSTSGNFFLQSNKYWWRSRDKDG